MKRVLFVGHARHGKDVACDALARATGWVNAGTTSLYLARHVAERLGVDEATAYANRHRDRLLWRQIGDEVRASDPALLVRDALRHGSITGGCRGLPEVRAVRAESLVDLIVWVERPGFALDDTMEFGRDEADIVVYNGGTEAQFRATIQRLGAALL